MSGGNPHLNVARAIRRSRRLRAAQQRRRRRSAALIAILAVALTGGGVWTIGAATGNDMVEAAVTRAQSLADLIAHRSPGARTEGQLTKTKHARALAKLRAAPAPHIRQPAPAAAPKEDMAHLAQLLQGPALVPVPVDLQRPLALAELSAPPPTLGGIIFPGPGSDSTPPGGSPPPTFPGTGPKQPIVPPPAVPEPQSWALMLLGFGIIGWRMRARTTLRPQVSR
jgi:PEP-CTERM motif